MNGLRIEFQDRVNFVILDWDTPDEHAFGTGLGMTYHPNFLSIAPNSDEVVRGLYASPRGGELEEMVEELVASYGN